MLKLAKMMEDCINGDPKLEFSCICVMYVIQIIGMVWISMLAQWASRYAIFSYRLGRNQIQDDCAATEFHLPVNTD
jgi:hypothetical protein